MTYLFVIEILSYFQAKLSIGCRADPLRVENMQSRKHIQHLQLCYIKDFQTGVPREMPWTTLFTSPQVFNVFCTCSHHDTTDVTYMLYFHMIIQPIQKSFANLHLYTLNSKHAKLNGSTSLKLSSWILRLFVNELFS